MNAQTISPAGFASTVKFGTPWVRLADHAADVVALTADGTEEILIDRQPDGLAIVQIYNVGTGHLVDMAVVDPPQ